MQRRIISLVESFANTLIGFGLSVGVGVLLYPFFGVTFNVAELSAITGVFTVVSIARGYGIRRLFNMAHVRGWW